MRLTITSFAILLFSLCQTNAQHIHLWDGETSDDLLCNTNDYFDFNTTQAYNGSHCLEGHFTPWHRATLYFGDCSYYRKNIAYTQQLCFHIKANIANPTVSVAMGGWHGPGNGASQDINIVPYISDGNVSTQYKQVCIPLNAFRDSLFTALWIEHLSFRVENPDTALRIYVDAISLKDTVPTSVSQIEHISNDVLRVHFDGRYDTALIKNTAQYWLTSTDDPAFVNPVYPAGVGMHYYYNGLEEENLWLLLPKAHFTVFLTFDQPLTNGKNYNLHIENVHDPAGNISPPKDIPYVYIDNTTNGSVKVNQVGYLPNSPKYAYVGNYLGSSGMMDIYPTTFEVRDATSHQIAYSGMTAFRANDTALSGEKVYDCDFSSFTQIGDFYIYVPGVGRSYDFSIHPAVYNNALLIGAKGVFLNRCGMHIAAAHAGPYARPACHQNDGLIHASIQNATTYGGEVVGAAHAVTGGWHDAGDYSRPLSNQIVLISDLLTAYEAFPQKIF